jgi:putative transcriptional regulator
VLVLETPVFTKRVTKLISDDDYRELQIQSFTNFKTGRSQGIQVMKKELFEELLKSVKQGGQILRGERKAARKFKHPEPDVRKIREKYGLSQEKFAALIGISVATLRNWEQGRRKPQGPARILLYVAAKHPQAVFDVVV